MPTPTTTEAQKMVAAIAREAVADAMAAVAGITSLSNAQALSVAEAGLRAAADKFKRAQQFLAQWP